MAACINRTMALMSSGDGLHTRTAPPTVVENIGFQVLPDKSPLQMFVKAKKKINDIYGEIEYYVNDIIEYIHDLEDQSELVTPEQGKQSEEFVDKVRGIRNVLSRDHMKVVFFGRTSNGKSSVINAMLRDKILPTGIGHTTNCFIKVEGSPSDEPYLLLESSDERYPVESVRQLAHALCKEKLNESTMVKVFWPKNRCLLLRDDVVFVDSPGVDTSHDLDEWIDKHCSDADVFVLVSNAESTLTVTEKNFFNKVAARLSKPNIFILNNRWDASANEPEFLDETRRQHQERAVEFLVEELKVCSQKEAEERIFFISAKEVLQARLVEQGYPVSIPSTEGFQTRYLEFEDFERKFGECISKSAVKTKFEQHSQRGQHIVNELRKILDHIYSGALKIKEEKIEQGKELYDKISYTEEQLMLITREMKLKIQLMVNNVQQRVSGALREQIRCLSTLVDEFNMSFHHEPLFLNTYKKELHLHVETGLDSNLRAGLSTALAFDMEASQKEITEKVEKLMPNYHKHASNSIMVRRQPFEILYKVNCDNLCADFQEDLQFRFSWGITTLIQRFAGSERSIQALNNKRESLQNSIMPATPVDDHLDTRIPYSSVGCDKLSLLSRLAVVGTTSQGSMFGLLVAGFLFKTVGLRLIACTGAVYGCLYMFERLTWTNKAKEKAFKEQYVQHATEKLEKIVDLTSANCSHQAQQELSKTFAQLCHLVDVSSIDMYDRRKKLEKEVAALQSAAVQAKVLRDKAIYLGDELELFEDTYVKQYQ